MRTYLSLLTLFLAACNNYPISTSRTNQPVDITEQCKILEKKKSGDFRNLFRGNPKFNNSNNIKPEVAKRSTFQVSQQVDISIEDSELYPSQILNFHSEAPWRAQKAITSLGKKHANLNISKDSRHKKNFLDFLSKEDKRKSVFKWIIPKVNSQVPILASIVGVFTILAFRFSRKRSLKLSHWASENPWKARGALTAIHLGTAAASFSLGDFLALDNMMVSNSSKIAALSIFGTSALLFPLSHIQLKPNFSKWRKDIRRIGYAGTFLSGAFLILYTGNHFELQERNVYEGDPVVTLSINKEYSVSNVTLANRHFQEKLLITNKDDKNKKKLSGGEKFLLTLLALAGFIGLAYLVLALSCTLACSGAEGAAYLVLFGGGALLTFLLIAALKGIHGKGKSGKKVKEEPDPLYSGI